MKLGDLPGRTAAISDRCRGVASAHLRGTAEHRRMSFEKSDPSAVSSKTMVEPSGLTARR